MAKEDLCSQALAKIAAGAAPLVPAIPRVWALRYGRSMIDAKRLSSCLVLAAALLLPGVAHAFCGFYVAGADTEVYNNATMVAMMRSGKTTVLSMGNNYQGPPEDFAMVVPVPVVLQKDNVKILPREVFSRLDKLAAPRLVEYWEQDPCPKPLPKGGARGHLKSVGSSSGSGYGRGAGGFGTPVVVEAKFAVGEYEIVILSAQDATGLETWLKAEGYKIPAGSAPFLRPYVEKGSKFFVAKVDPSKVTFKDGMASLSPLRFHYTSEDFSLPVRLGLINAKDKQDLIVHILAKDKRYEVANYKNVTVPTNLVVKNDVRQRFGEFYAALFDATIEKNPGAVVTEYAWASNSCDPCPAPALNQQELMTLGMDVVQVEGVGGFQQWGASSGAQWAPGPSGTSPKPGGIRGMSGQTMARIRMGKLEVSEGLDSNVIRRYLRRKLTPMRACYEAALVKRKKLAGSLVAKFRIGRDGVVGKNKVKGLPASTITSCMNNIIGSIQFPNPKGEKPVVVSYPFELSQQARSSFGGRSRGGMSNSWVLTRLHARYDRKSLGEDLVFQEAGAIAGGQGGGGDSLSKIAKDSGNNTFQGRYIIRHPWEGAIDCTTPRRGVWGSPPPGVSGSNTPKAATDLAFAARNGTSLASMLGEPLPAEAFGSSQASTASENSEAAPQSGEETSGDTPKGGAPDAKPTKETGCSTSGGSGNSGLVFWFLALLVLVRRRRPRL